ncbi:MAG: PEGA domain-containing protein, partial [Methanomicrobiales archaeon]|nr:PEGA domain-containing protein [Methanomicrobiales archaeon]
TNHNSPYTLTGITTGQHAVTLKLNGYQDFSQNVTVTSGQTTTITAILSPIVTTGSIYISSTPTGTQIYLDGNSTSHNTPYTLTGITAGQHALTLKLNGYQDYNQNVTVIAELIALVNATLTPTTGAISFSSIPGGAQIYLGGNNSGHTTPYTLTGISPGMNPIMLRLSGYQDYNQNVTVVAGQTAVINATLSPEGWTPITAPCIISTPGHYRLTNDLTNSTAETAIWIQSSDVFLSGDGHTLNGISAENTTGVLASMDGVTLSNITMVNLSVTGWESGFKVFGVEHGGLLWSCSATGNNRGVLVAESPYFTMGLCTVEDNIPYIDHGISMGGTGVTLTNSSGTYILDSNISHNGWGDNPPFVGGYGILLNDCPGVLVENCTINKNINTGVWNDQSPGMRVIRNEFHDNSGNGGIFMTAREEAPVMNCTIRDNHISGSGWGIFLRNNDYLVKNNQVSECGYGILLESSQNSTLQGNTLKDNELNLAVNGQNEEDYHHQIDTTNTVNGKPVYYLVGQTGAVIDGATNAGVVYGISCPNLTVRDLELRNNQYGVFLIGSDRAVITNVTALGNTIGFNILSSNAVLLDHCTATLNPINGFMIRESDGVQIRNSVASENNDPEGGAGTGISVQNCYSFHMEKVTSSKNSMLGIELDNAHQTDLKYVKVETNGVSGIVVKGDSIQIIGSTIRDNDGPGIGMLESNNVTIWNNYFSNNENVDLSNALVTGSSWNITKTTGTNIVNGPFLGGNYWAKPDGTGWSQVTPDRGDGFCNAPFVYDSDNTDYLPLHTYTPPPSSDNITLGVGWNMVSVPKKLAPGYDTGSIFKNVTTEGRTIWEYDGVIRNWVPVSEDTPVLPLYGFWIYSKYPTTVPLKFDPNPLQVPPTRKLVKGWELIGFTGTIPASARDTLISVRNNWTQAMGFDTTAYQYDIQIINGGSGQFSDSRLMSPTKGYWLFMTGPGDLSAIGV